MKLRAFSLLELSIVFVVIGILVSGISAGIDLYQDFRLATARSLTLNSRVGRIEGLMLWLETTSEKSFENPRPKDGDLIGTWKDINPSKISNFNLTQANDTLKPIYISKYKDSSLPALKFNNLQTIEKADVRGYDLFDSTSLTIFLVQNTSGGQDTTLSWVPTNSSGNEIARLNLHLQHNSRSYFDFSKSGVGNGRIEYINNISYVNKNTIFHFMRNNSNMEMAINGAIVASNSASGTIESDLVAPFIVGKLRTDANYTFDGTISEIIIINRPLSSKETIEIEEYLSKKYSIKVSK
jgi:type II secretory pathway pseudopilin PulG